MLPRGQDQATSLIACTVPVSPQVVTTISIGLTGAGLTAKTVRQVARSAARRIQALSKRRATGAHSFSTDRSQEFDQGLELAATVTPQEPSHPLPLEPLPEADRQVEPTPEQVANGTQLPPQAFLRAQQHLG